MGDAHVTVRAWHLTALVMLLLGAWQLRAPAVAAGDQTQPAFAVRAMPQSLSAGSTSELPDTRSPVPAPIATPAVAPPAASGAPLRLAPGGVQATSTQALVTELHRRDYTWEALDAARLRFSDFSEVELINWLQRDAPRFQVKPQRLLHWLRPLKPVLQGPKPWCAG